MTTTAAPALPPQIHKFLSGGPKKMYLGGKWVESASGKTFKTMNPATGEPLAEVCEATEADVEQAVLFARKAFESGLWSKVNPAEKAKILWKIADLIEKNIDELAALETLNNGMPIREGRYAELPLAIESFRYWAGWTTKISGETLPTTTPYAPKTQFFTYTVKEPVGVVAAIIPWNLPLQMAAWKMAPALACGNVLILKPAEQTPLTALRLAEIMEEAGLPPGVVQVLPGFGPTAGRALVAHRGVDKVSFTGSPEVAREIVKASAGDFKRVSLELGGKSPHIVFADADLDAASKSAYMGIFYNQGQMCCAGSRIFVEKPAFEALSEKLAERAKKARLGPGIDPNTQMGPVISEEQLKRVQSYVDSGKKDGAKVLAGGDRPSNLGKGYFYNPTVFVDVKDEMKIAREEIFGPVAAVMPFESVEEVIARSNRTDYGLAAGIWTKDIKKAFRMAAALRAGTVWINAFNFADNTAPWGGFKASGWGRENGPQAIDLYTEVKTVWVDLNG